MRSIIQNDGEGWILNEQLEPVIPVRKNLFLELGLSIDPRDIPKERLNKSIIDKKREELLRDSLNLVK